MMGPATFVVFVVFLLLVLAGVVLLRRGCCDTSTGPRTCPYCGRHNNRGARYCGQCGRPLG